MSITFYPDDYVFEFQAGDALPRITFMDDDTFTAASRYDNACCLNFASHKRPGGGYLAVMDIRGPIRTQEEDLFRRSNLPEIMDNDKVRAYYPLREAEGLYCSGVVVSKDKKLNPINPFITSVVTVPAVVNPDMADGSMKVMTDLSEAIPAKHRLVIRRAERIFEIAAHNRHRVLILGAWGCGVFNNNPLVIANLFQRLITQEYVGLFDEVVFAIPGRTSANYRIFESVLAR